MTFRFTRTVISLLALSVSAAAADDAGRTLVHEAVIDAPVAEVWRMWTTGEGARQWMAPKVEVDLRVGGAYRSSYNPDSTLDDEHTIINRILTYEPHRMIAIRNEQAPAGFKWAESFQQTWSVTCFEPVGESRTKLRIVGLGYGEGPEWDELYAHFEWGNQYILDKLQKTIADGASRVPASGQGPVSDESSGPIVAEALIPAPLTDVWRAWTTNEGAQAFFAPRTNIKLAIGGPYEILFAPDNPPGERGAEGLRVLSYAPMEMLSFEWNAPPHLPHAREHPNWVVLYVHAVSDDETLVRLVHLGWEEMKKRHPEHAAEWDAAREYFVRVWPHVLEKLARRFMDDSASVE